MSAPGAGKTSLLEAALRDGREGVLDVVRVGVLEGDVQGSIDADRLSHLHVPVSSSTPTAASAASATSTRTWCAPRSQHSRWTTSTC